MSSLNDRYDDTVVMDFNAIIVLNKERAKTSAKSTYTNLRCDYCKEWWVMLCLDDRKKVYCPWCGAKCKVKER